MIKKVKIFLYLLASLIVLIKLVNPTLMESKVVIGFFLRSGVNKNRGIINNAYQIAQSGPTILMLGIREH